MNAVAVPAAVTPKNDAIFGQYLRIISSIFPVNLDIIGLTTLSIFDTNLELPNLPPTNSTIFLTASSNIVKNFLTKPLFSLATSSATFTTEAVTLVKALPSASSNSAPTVSTNSFPTFAAVRVPVNIFDIFDTVLPTVLLTVFPFSMADLPSFTPLSTTVFPVSYNLCGISFLYKSLTKFLFVLNKCSTLLPLSTYPSSSPAYLDSLPTPKSASVSVRLYSSARLSLSSLSRLFTTNPANAGPATVIASAINSFNPNPPNKVLNIPPNAFPNPVPLNQLNNNGASFVIASHIPLKNVETLPFLPNKSNQKSYCLVNTFSVLSISV